MGDGYFVADKSLTRPSKSAFAPWRRWDYAPILPTMVFPPFDPAPPPFRRRFKAIPVRTLLPNLITLLALCAGLTAIRLAVEDKLDWAVAAIVFAALLGGIDGRVARMPNGTARVGPGLRSRADVLTSRLPTALVLS